MPKKDYPFPARDQDVIREFGRGGSWKDIAARVGLPKDQVSYRGNALGLRMPAPAPIEPLPMPYVRDGRDIAGSTLPPLPSLQMPLPVFKLRYD